MSIKFLWTWKKFVKLLIINYIYLCIFVLTSDVSAPTLVNSKTNLHKGDLFVINLSDDNTQKLVMQVDEERSSSSMSPGNLIKQDFYILICLYSIEILIDESIKRTFSVISFMRNYLTVQKVAVKEVRYTFVV